MKRLLAMSVLFLLASGMTVASAAEVPTTSPASASAAKKLPNTVGVDISKKVVNPDQTVTLTFHWKDKDKVEQTRSVVLNDKTIIGIDGQLKTLNDLTEDQLKKKAVATVSEDGVTAISLRIGRAKIVASPDVVAAATPTMTPEATVALARSDAAMEKRVNGIVQSLQLNDAAKEARIQQVLMTDLKAIRDSHNLGFAPEKSVHANLLTGLAADLTPEQVETVKDRLTANKVPVTFKAYHDIVPNLTPEDDTKILELLKKAREDSLDVKNVDEMTPIFKTYKLQIQAYLNAHGHDWAKSYKEYVNAHKAEPTTMP